MPFAPWDGVAGSGSVGYCTHGSNLFGPWHRPYLALFEQQIYEIATRLAGQYPAGSRRQQNQAAARTLRMPYWDWAMRPPNNGPVLPTLLSNPTVNVNYPNGSIATIENPLYAYRFRPLNPSEIVYSPFTIYPTTLRWPSSSGASASSSSNSVNSQMTSSLTNFRNQLMAMFANYQVGMGL